MCDDIFFCIPIIFGCDEHLKQTDTTPHVCPRCHNAQVVSAHTRRWFSLCWVPLIPTSSKNIWVCGICQWRADADGSYQPPLAGAGGYGGPGGPYGAPQGYPPPGY